MKVGKRIPCAHAIAYFSPAGSTERVARTLRDQLLDLQQEAVLFDLSRGQEEVVDRLVEYCRRPEPCCLWIGSPVYCDHAVPLVEACIRRLPREEARYGVPFVTWGGVTSGLALVEMGELLHQQGYLLLGAAKVLAVHSSMWGAPQPLVQGHPNETDLDIVRTVARRVVEKVERGETVELALDVLDYLSPWLRADAAGKSLAGAKAARPPLEADNVLCTGCGVCLECCPVQAISMEGVPLINDKCVLCMQCVRNCPEQAFPFDHAATARLIGDMAAASDEDKQSQGFW